MNKYCATFYTHYGAMKFNKKCAAEKMKSKLAPVPRKISASCTTCVFFDAESTSIFNDISQIDDLEGCYLVVGEGYEKVIEGQK